MKTFYETQLEMARNDPTYTTPDDISEMTAKVKSKALEVEKWRAEITNDRETSLLEREEALSARERALIELETTGKSHTKRLSDEREEVAQLLQGLHEQTKRAQMDRVSSKERESQEHERLVSLERSLQNEIDTAKDEYGRKMERIREEKDRMEAEFDSDRRRLSSERESFEGLRAELAKDKIAWEASTVAAAAEVQVAMKRNADEEARLTGERCEVMDERAELEAMGKDLKRDAELLCEEREVFESENEALKHKVAEVMKLGQQVEGQSEALRLRHREAEEKHVEATHRLLLAKEAKRNSDEELALAEQHRERGEALKKQHEQERIEMAQMRLKFTSEKWAEPRGGGGSDKMLAAILHLVNLACRA